MAKDVRDKRCMNVTETIRELRASAPKFSRCLLSLCGGSGYLAMLGAFLFSKESKHGRHKGNRTLGRDKASQG